MLEDILHFFLSFLGVVDSFSPCYCCCVASQVKEAMQRIHDRGNIGKLILDVEKTPTPLVCQYVVCGITKSVACKVKTCH